MIFLSHWINGKTPCYGGRQENLVIEPSSRMEEGATSNSLKVHLSNHVGTHMDFPRHFDAQGKTLSDYSAIDLSFQAPKLISMELLPEHMISVEDLKDHVDDQMDFLLLR
ncbi:MAG TPA: hypothetical protein DCL41_05725, partial [Bdellovibrionales bacterium]|nr:hypothetical protein [Bdellovibrionales bacterium]